MRSVLTILGGIVAVMVFLGTPAQAQMHFSRGYSGGNCSDCAWISAQGDIGADTPERFETFLRENTDEYTNNRGAWLFINSPGGNVAGGIALGRLVRRYGMKVRVASTVDYPIEGAGRDFQTPEAGVCASACVFALMGGVTREVSEDSRVGIHQFGSALERSVRENEALSSAQSAVAELSGYAASMGVSPDIIALASAVPPSDMLWLTNRQLEQARLVTTIQTVEEVEWGLQPQGSALSAVVVQPQENGMPVGFLAVCASNAKWQITALIPRTENTDDIRLPEIASSIEAVGLGDRWNPTVALGSYAFKASATEEGIFLTFAIPQTDFVQLANSASSQFVTLTAPNAYYSELSGSAYLIPRANLAELLPHINRSCHQ